MEQVIDFTIGFSENVAWPWPIAVYLFLAGISGGAFAAAALVRIFRKQTQITPLTFSGGKLHCARDDSVGHDLSGV